jgi:two-component system OmpR family response regulator
MDQTRLLVIEDDPDISALLAEFLGREGYEVRTLETGKLATQTVAGFAPGLVILDIMLPGEDGLSVCRRIRAESHVPIIMLTAKTGDIDKIVGLEIGADDYMSKPCNPRELVARAKAVLRRRDNDNSAPGESVRFAGFRIDIARRELIDPDDVVIPLSAGEFRLLRAFVERPQRVLSREQLLDYAFDNDSDVFDRAVDVQVSRLRRKLERPGGIEIIRTVRGEGYLFAVKPTS